MKLKLIPLVVLVFSLSSAFALDDSATSNMAKAGFSPEGTETRITDLHSKLKINDAQEALWKTVTQEMRDNAKAMKDVAESREKKAKDMSALDDLKSYSEIASLHADGMKKFLDVFTPLYNAMSDDQKKNADEIFRGHKETMKKHK